MVTPCDKAEVWWILCSKSSKFYFGAQNCCGYPACAVFALGCRGWIQGTAFSNLWFCLVPVVVSKAGTSLRWLLPPPEEVFVCFAARTLSGPELQGVGHEWLPWGQLPGTGQSVWHSHSWPGLTLPHNLIAGYWEALNSGQSNSYMCKAVWDCQHSFIWFAGSVPAATGCRKKNAALSGEVFYNLNNTLFMWVCFFFSPFFNVVFLERVLAMSATRPSNSFVPMLLNLCLCQCIS